MGTDTHNQYGGSDEGLHPANDNPLWQESVLLHWYDRKQGIGGWHRVGHEPNNQGGKAAIWSYVFDRSGWQYRRCGDVPLSGSDRYSGGFGAGETLQFRYRGDAAHWDVKEGPLSAHIECRNLFPILDPFPHSDELAKKRFANHFEVAGRVTGEVTYEGRTTKVEGFGYRDHSWGPRDWQSGMLNHRWFTGTLGGELSFAAITAQARTGKLTRVGFIHRDGKTVRADGVDVIVHIEPDGLTHRGGELRLTLPSGEVVHIACTARAGVLFQRGTVAMAEMICDAEGHGLKGYCDAELSSNPRGGVGEPLLSINATMTDGFSPFTPLVFP